MNADHLIAFVLAAFLPLYGVWSWRWFERALASGREDARLTSYAETMLLEWSLTVVVLIQFLATGRSPRDLGLVASLTGRFGITVIIVVILSVLLLSQIRAVRAAEGEAFASIRRRMAGVEKMMPHTTGERKIFLELSLTAGFCEELLYRGFLIGYFVPLTGPVAAVAISSAIFGLAHAYQGGAGIVKTGIVGAVMGIIYVASGSIWPAVVLHAVLDIQAGLIGYDVFGRRVMAGEGS